MHMLKWLLLVILVTACTLTTTTPRQIATPVALALPVEETEEPINTPTTDAEVFPEDDDDSDLVPSGVNQPASNPTVQPVISQPITCGVRTDWLAYVVQPGDTLGDLARRTSSTVNELAQGNCLADPNALEVGQVLRVPRVPTAQLPPTQTFTIGQTAQVTQAGQNLRVRAQPGTGFATVGELVPRICVTITGGPVQANGFTWWRIQGPRGLNGWVAEASGSEIWLSPQFTTCESVSAGPGPQTFNCLDPRWQFTGSNIVNVSPVLGFNNGCYQIGAGTVVTLTWPHAPGDAIQVTFYRRSDSSARTDTLGVDNTPGDGWSIPYTVAAGMPPSGLWAESISHGQGTLRSSDLAGFHVSPVVGGCPQWIATTANAPQLNPTIGTDGQCVQVAPGSTLTITWPGAPADATEVTFYRNNPAMSKADVMGIDSNGVDGWSITVPAVGWQPSVIYARSISAPVQGIEGESGTVGIIVKN